MAKISPACVVVLAVVLGSAGAARAELTPWDQAKVSALAKQLHEASKALYDTFYKQPVPQAASGQANDYRRLKQEVRRIQSEARELADALAKGGSREDTLPVYEHLMEIVRSARTSSQRVFTTQDVQSRATDMRQLLNQIAPYYDPDAVPYEPPRR